MLDSSSRFEDGQIHGGDQTGNVGDALPGNVKGGSVIDAGADHWEAQRDVDAGIEIQRFERDQSLIVVHADETVC